MVIFTLVERKKKILLVGEFSRLHNSLKIGLENLGHEVLLINNGDGFKNYPADISIRAHFFKSKIGNIPRQIWYKLFKFDLALLEHGLRFWLKINQLKDFDIVQLINEKPIQTCPRLELFLLKKLFNQNSAIFLLSCGIDYLNLQHLLAKKERYSILEPYFENNKNAKKELEFAFEYNTTNHKLIHNFIFKNCKGVIATDLDYVNANKNNTKYLGFIPNPVVINASLDNPVKDKIIIFLGINSGNKWAKGIRFFKEALEKVRHEFDSKINIVITTDIPYSDYQKHYQSAHILLDQVYGYDQGYNALEAMAQGKVVFTGADQEFLNYYQLKEDEVAINALPNSDAIFMKLKMLIENPQLIEKIGNNAQLFIRKQHDTNEISQLYLKIWS